MKEKNVKKLLWATWIVGILCMISFAGIIPLSKYVSQEDVVKNMLVGFYGVLVMILGLLSVGFLNGIRSRLSPKQKKPFLLLTIATGVLFIFLAFVLKGLPLPDLVLDSLTFVLLGSFILSGIYSLTCYLHLYDKIFIGFVAGIVIGLILNRFGLEIAGFIVGFCCFLSFYGFLFYAISYSRKSKDHKQFRRMIAIFCYIISIIFLLLFFKFSSDKPAFTKNLDTIGVIIFLIATIGLFISMPFSNFIEWLNSQRQEFYKIILLPLVFFLVVFSLTFLLPDSTYRKIFFIEYSKSEKVHFWMDDYESEFD